ncbi:sulfotransferase [Sphingomonas pruni]|uniref:sulfotransferase n=1 Tax=Sphingomonas pruni TaxID=40683 RepID=UPI000835C20B|nr:sulfotransferase [Sphingomonas pruni]
MSDPDALGRLRAMILTDEALADRLALTEDRDAFAAAAAEAGHSGGIKITAEAILASSKRDPLGIERFTGQQVTTVDWPGRNWLPAALVPAPGQLAIDWVHFGDAPLRESFFEDSLRCARRRPINALSKVCTPLDILAKPAPADATAAPDGLIFHMSRCGSTLVSQMLAAMPGGIVVSEAPPLDAIVQMTHSHPEAPLDQRVALLRGMAAALGRDRFGNRRHYVIKTDSWHSLALPLFRAAFPDTPWVFLFRDPIEVMVSQMGMRGSQTVPGTELDAVFAIPDPHSLSTEDHIARVLNRVTQAAVDHAEIGGGLFVDYAELPYAVERRILPHFGIEANPEGLAAMHAAATWDAKTPSFAFAPDSDDQRRTVGDAIRAATAAHLDGMHHQLTALAAR